MYNFVYTTKPKNNMNSNTKTTPDMNSQQKTNWMLFTLFIVVFFILYYLSQQYPEIIPYK